MREPITDAELGQWANVRADDAGHLARELISLRQAIGKDGRQFMQSLVDDASTEKQKRKAAEARIAELEAACGAVRQDIVDLVIAAREAFDCAFLPEEESRALDKALEPFASKVRYANEPDEDDATKPSGAVE